MAHNPQIQAVILGGDLGAYALARELNEACGIIPTIVTSYDPLPTRHSAIVHRHELAHADKEHDLIKGLSELGQSLKRNNPDMPLVLLANTDWRIHVIARNRSTLEKYYEFALPPLSTIESVSDKSTFERLASAQGICVPRSQIQDFSGADDPTWAPQPRCPQLEFPLVAKPVTSAAYETVLFEGRKKIYYLRNDAELEELWTTLARAGFRDRFMIQELIEGDDTSMYSVTAYIDSQHRMTMGVAARVLLEEHAPDTLGNPCAMITLDAPHLLEAAERFLLSIDYHGFANFDIKYDQRSNRYYFLEVNPRIGRNSYYCVAAGVNPMSVMLADIIDNRSIAPIRAYSSKLYSIIPTALLRRYVVEPSLRATVSRLTRSRRTVDPLANPADSSLRRRCYSHVLRASQVRKFMRYYPRPTRTGF